MVRAYPIMVVSMLAAAPCLAQAQSFQGSWTLDPARSTMSPGEPPPKSSVMRVTVDDGRNFAWTQTTVGPDGKSSSTSFKGAFDGRPYPISNGGGNLAFTRPSPTSFTDKGSDPSGGHWTETCTIGSDQRTLTCNGQETDPHGQSQNYTDVWVKG